MTDEQLVRPTGLGEREALEALYDRYVGRCYSLAFRIVGDSFLAEDIVQDVYLTLWTYPLRYVSGRGKFVNWLLATGRVYCSF